MSDDIIECRICNKRHHMDKCPMVKQLDPMTLVFCKGCGIHYNGGCDKHDPSEQEIVYKK